MLVKSLLSTWLVYRRKQILGVGEMLCGSAGRRPRRMLLGLNRSCALLNESPREPISWYRLHPNSKRNTDAQQQNFKARIHGARGCHMPDSTPHFGDLKPIRLQDRSRPLHGCLWTPQGLVFDPLSYAKVVVVLEGPSLLLGGGEFGDLAQRSVLFRSYLR